MRWEGSMAPAEVRKDITSYEGDPVSEVGKQR